MGLIFSELLVALGELEDASNIQLSNECVVLNDVECLQSAVLELFLVDVNPSCLRLFKIFISSSDKSCSSLDDGCTTGSMTELQVCMNRLFGVARTLTDM